MARITAYVYDSYTSGLRDALDEFGMDARLFSSQDLRAGADPREILESMASSDLVLLHLMGDSLPPGLDSGVRGLDGPVVLSFGHSPMAFAYTTGRREDALKCEEYLSVNGRENCRGCVLYLLRNVFGRKVDVPDPVELPWHGIVHPRGGRFSDLKGYLEWYRPRDAPWVGLIVSRSCWANEDFAVETKLMDRLEERGFNVVAAYAMPRTDSDLGKIGLAEAVKRYMHLDGRFLPSALVKIAVLQFGDPGDGDDGGLLESLDVPVFQPVVPSAMSKEAFEEAPGLVTDIAYGIALQETEGMTDPVLIGFARERTGDDRRSVPLPDRIDRLVGRIARRVSLRSRPNSEKRVAFILNDFPCAGAEANVGEGVNLNVMDSLVNILRRMRRSGYRVEVPESGAALMSEIMRRKAVQDFRWTSSDEISRCGGVLYRMPASEYAEWYAGLPDGTRADMERTWGAPPGEGMVLDGSMLITGLDLGNAVVMVQPKRGCYGPKCDGTVCRALHDPACPPTHQYLATYRWIDAVWKADAVVDVGTHGSMEYLPGKSCGMTGGCYPDICIGDLPFFYIFDAGATGAAVAAKRRAYATVIDHMPPAFRYAESYGPVADMERLLDDYASAAGDSGRDTKFARPLRDAAKALGVDPRHLGEGRTAAEVARACTEEVARLMGSRIPIGLHTMGAEPDESEIAGIVSAAVVRDVRKSVAESRGLSVGSMLSDPSGPCAAMGTTNERALRIIDGECSDAVAKAVRGEPSGLGEDLDRRISRIASDIRASDEIGAVIRALDGGYTRPGPAGSVCSGRSDVLPTGRNMYILDPLRLPSRASWAAGRRLAESTVASYERDHGEPPRTVSVFWTSFDLVNDGGEAMCQMLHLIGAEPVWSESGEVRDVRIVPLEELGRPRIDVVIRASGLMRDTFPNSIDLIDTAMTRICALDEPPEMNFVRAHFLESVESGIPEEDASARVFSSPPGSATSGVTLAVLANAWRTDADLAEVYLAGNCYAYGNRRDGKPLMEQFANGLAGSSATYMKVGSDGHDLLNSYGYYGNLGGMAAVARVLSGREIDTYIGDTREQENIHVHSLREEINRSVRTRLFNPQWIEGMRRAGYQGAADIMKRAVRIYGFGATAHCIDDSVYDEITNTFINDPGMMEFFRSVNPYAAEEIGRRLLEAQERGLWRADPATLERLRSNYLLLEGDMEELAGDSEVQGGSTEIASYVEIDAWRESNGRRMDEARRIVSSRKEDAARSGCAALHEDVLSVPEREQRQLP